MESQFQKNLVLHYITKALQKHIYYKFCLWFWIALISKTPCFHRLVSIQIDSPLPQGVTQPVSRGSNVTLHNTRTPNLIFDLFWLWFWIALKRKLPVSTDQFQFRLTVHCPNVSLSQFQEDLMFHYITKPSKSHIVPVLPVILDSSIKGNSLFPQRSFDSDWQSTAPGCHSASFKRIWCCIT